MTEKLPSFPFDKFQWNVPPHVNLADSNFNVLGNIDLLLGADVFWKLLCIGQIKLGKNKPILQKTHLGWVVSGPINCNHLTQTACNLSLQHTLDTQLLRFWDIVEAQEPLKLLSIEEQFCETSFMETTTREEYGRFTVHLPLRENTTSLGESKSIALRRFYSLERKLNLRRHLKQQYTEFLDEYQKLCHMSLVDDEIAEDIQTYYLPHHAVVKEQHTTTKLRVVFDASAKTSSGYSLNDLQATGPTIQDDFFFILLRFRKHNIVLTGDIEKMYRQIFIIPNQRPLQRILWRSNSSEPIRTYQLNTVTYGTTAAPFLAIRCIHQLANENSDQYPVRTSIIKKDFYVDDLITGAQSMSEVIQLKTEISSILKSGGFVLCKWASNEPQVLSDDTELHTQPLFPIQSDGDIKTLGVYWSSNSDRLKYVTSNLKIHSSPTK